MVKKAEGQKEIAMVKTHPVEALYRKETARGLRIMRKLLHGNLPEPETDYLEENPKHIFNASMIGICLLLAFMVCLCAKLAHGYTEEEAIKAVIGEAEGEPQLGKEAIACSLHYRGYLNGVYGLKSPRVIYHKYSHKTYIEAQQAVDMSDDEEYCDGLVHGAQYWASLKSDKHWIKWMERNGYERTAKIGNQVFYRKD